VHVLVHTNIANTLMLLITAYVPGHMSSSSVLLTCFVLQHRTGAAADSQVKVTENTTI